MCSLPGGCDRCLLLLFPQSIHVEVSPGAPSRAGDVSRLVLEHEADGDVPPRVGAVGHDQHQLREKEADLVEEDGVLTGKVRIQVYFDQKAEWVKRILEKFKVRSEEVIAIGDSKGDLDMFQMVGFSIAFNSSCKDLDRIASVCIPSQNLADIIPRLPI